MRQPIDMHWGYTEEDRTPLQRLRANDDRGGQVAWDPYVVLHAFKIMMCNAQSSAGDPTPVRVRQGPVSPSNRGFVGATDSKIGLAGLSEIENLLHCTFMLCNIQSMRRPYR